MKEIKVNLNDKIQLDIMDYVKTGQVNLLFQINNGRSEDYMIKVRNMQKYGSFRISEKDNSLSVKPFVLQDSLKITFSKSISLSNYKIEQIRNKICENEFEINDALNYIEFIPDNGFYILKLSYSDNISSANTVSESKKNSVFKRPMAIMGNNSFTDSDSGVGLQNVDLMNDPELMLTTQNIDANSKKLAQLKEMRKNAKEKLQKIEKEYNKNWNLYQQEIKNIKAQMNANENIIQYYKNKDIASVENIFREINKKLAEAEKIISFFIKEKEQKMSEIDKKIKSNNHI